MKPGIRTVETSWRRLATTFAHHGEGPAWDAARASLLWVDVTGRCVHRTGLDGATTTVGLGDAVGAAVPTADGGLLAAVGQGVERVDLPTGVVRSVATIDGRRPVRVNDGGCDPAGRFWVGTMDLDGERPVGALYRLDDDRLTLVVDAVTVANGPTWSPDGRTMYFTDTPTGIVWAYPYDPAAGTTGERRVAVDCRALSGGPDGMACDDDGCLWIAFWDGWAVRRFAPGGELLEEHPVPVARPTSCAFGGEDRRTLLVTTSRYGLSGDALAVQPLAGTVLAAEVGVAGPVPPPARA